MGASETDDRQPGVDGALEEMERTVRERNGADDRRRIHREAGMDRLLQDLVERAVPLPLSDDST